MKADTLEDVDTDLSEFSLEDSVCEIRSTLGILSQFIANFPLMPCFRVAKNRVIVLCRNCPPKNRLLCDYHLDILRKGEGACYFCSGLLSVKVL